MPSPGEPFWSGVTAFFANEVALFTLDKLDLITTKNIWLSLVSSVCVFGVVYGRAKVAEIRELKGKEPLAVDTSTDHSSDS
jgi:hypothetical protein